MTLPRYPGHREPGKMRGNPCRRSKLSSVQQARMCAQPAARRRGTRTAREVRYAAVAFCVGKAMACRRQERRARRARRQRGKRGRASRGGAGGNLVGREIGSTRDSPLPDRFSAQSPTAAPSPRSLVSHLSPSLPVPCCRPRLAQHRRQPQHPFLMSALVSPLSRPDTSPLSPPLARPRYIR